MYVVRVDGDPPDYKAFRKSADAVSYYDEYAPEAKIFRTPTAFPREAVQMVKDGQAEEVPPPPTPEDRQNKAFFAWMSRLLGMTGSRDD